MNTSSFYLKLDVREHDLIQCCKEFNDLNRYDVEQLPLGDAIITAEDGEEIVLFERKSILDLIASIKDGRYEEQSYRLGGSPFHKHNIVYIIEGVLDRTLLQNNTTRTLFYSSMISLLHFKGFSVVRTTSLKETAEYLIRFMEKMNRDKAKGKTGFYKNQLSESGAAHDNESTEESNPSTTVSAKTLEEMPLTNSYTSVIKRVKKENVTPENIGEIMLCQIPGISTSTAKAIMEKYHTIPFLVDSMKTDPTCLNDMKYAVSGGTKEQFRKINKTNIVNLFTYFGIGPGSPTTEG